MNNKIQILVFLVLILNQNFLLEGSNISGGSGTAGFAFLKMPVGTRAQAMGENFTAVADDVSTIFYNPAGLLKIKDREISAEYIVWFEQISKSNINFVYPGTKIGPIGIGINYVSIPYEKREFEDDTGYQSSSIWMGVFQLTWARLIRESILVGCGIKYINENLDIKSTSGLAADVGVISNFSNLVTIGASLQNIGGQLSSENSDSLPFLLRVGISKKFFEEKLLVASDINYGFVDETLNIGIGGEYKLSSYFYPRVGYKFNVTNTNLDFIAGLNVGFGIEYKNFGIDYAMSPKSDLGIVHMVSFSVKF
jgi:hypothetical protein